MLFCIFEERPGCGVICGPSPNNECPTGQTCIVERCAKNIPVKFCILVKDRCHMTCVAKVSGTNLLYIIPKLIHQIKIKLKF